jgi:hypothetical protein
MASARENQLGTELTGAMSGVGEPDDASWLQAIGPTYLAYLMGPIALVAVLLLMHFGAIVREPTWVWIAVFVAVPLSSFLADALNRAHPSVVTLHMRIAMHAAAVATSPDGVRSCGVPSPLSPWRTSPTTDPGPGESPRSGALRQSEQVNY